MKREFVGAEKLTTWEALKIGFWLGVIILVILLLFLIIF